MEPLRESAGISPQALAADPAALKKQALISPRSCLGSG